MNAAPTEQDVIEERITLEEVADRIGVLRERLSEFRPALAVPLCEAQMYWFDSALDDLDALIREVEAEAEALAYEQPS